MSFTKEGQTVTLQGISSEESSYTCVALSAIQMGELDPIPPEMQLLVEEFADVFATPIELPPRSIVIIKFLLFQGQGLYP